MRRLCLLWLSVVLVIHLAACSWGSAPPPAAREVLAAMQDAMVSSAQPLPDGRVYTRAADPDSPAYLTDVLFAALYGEAARGLFEADGDAVAPVSDAAVYLSLAAYPCELAVFRCSDTRTAATVAGLCQSRLDTLARGYAATEWAELAARGRVSVKDCFVLMVLCDDPARTLAAARRAVG